MINAKTESKFTKLKQLLKFASIVRTGGMAKELIKESLIRVNDKTETRRGKELYPGDVVEFEGEKYVVE